VTFDGAPGQHKPVGNRAVGKTSEEIRAALAGRYDSFAAEDGT
jgi:hypothetical protein